MSAAAADVGGFLPSSIPEGVVVAGRYRIVRKIAEGAAASVYLARDAALGGEVALKVLDPLRGADPVGRVRFEREFAVLSRLNHPGIARCLRYERDGDLDVLVLEYVEGPTLAARLADGRLDVEEARDIALRLAEALAACHAEGVLHRDLKPGNVILHPDRGPVILDFGVAWFGAAANLTRTGAVIGSPQYMAPEVFVSSLHDGRSDLYSLGAILFEMLTGRAVRLVDGVAELALAHLREASPSAATLRPEVGTDLDAVVAKAIAPRAEDRFATAGEFCEALRRGAVAAGAGVKTRTTCTRCRSALVVDLGFCPGCGRAVSWNLRPGPYAVQLGDIPDVARCAAWLERRHARTLGALRGPALRRRLAHTPVPLAVGVAEDSAEQLVAEATDAGCRAEIVRSRAVVGARLRASAASAGEAAVAGLMHAGAVLLAGVAIKLARLDDIWLAFVPTGVSILGIVAATIYVRRPVLRLGGSGIVESIRPVAPFAATLAALTTDRARQVAAAAVVRAAPAMTSEARRLPPAAREQALAQLGVALAAASDLDKHAALLGARSRSQLAAEIERARAASDAGDGDAVARLVSLRRERDDLVEASQAHDFAVRQALEASRSITAALAITAAVARHDDATGRSRAAG